MFAGVLVAVIGIFAFLVGAYLYSYSETTDGWFFVIYYPHRDLGEILVPVGIVVVAIGGVIYDLLSRPNSERDTDADMDPEPGEQSKYIVCPHFV